MSADLEIPRRKWKVLAFCTLMLVVTYVSYLHFTSFRDASHPSDTATIIQELQVPAPWWETKDCLAEPLAYDKLQRAGGTCGHRAWTAGEGQRVLSFSLFGNNSEYWKGMNQILPEVEQLYPGWKVRLYTDPRGRKAALCPLMRSYPSLLFVCDITNLPPPLGDLSNVHPMVWRVAPLGDPQVAAMVARDTDSPIIKREVAAVQAWLASGKAFHVMRDHPYHNVPVLGGMWGARWEKVPSSSAPNMKLMRNRIIARAAGKKGYGKDQEILQMVLWPVMAGRVMAHDSYNCQRFKDSSPWPTQRENNTFVGSPRFRKEHEHSSISEPCPEACRPPAHRDWLYC